jgi:hypothetical protein
LLPCLNGKSGAASQTRLLASLHGPTAFFSLRRPIFPLRLAAKRSETMPEFPKVPSSGFGYPLDGFSCPTPRESFSVPNAPGLRSSKLCSDPAIETPFQVPPPLSRFSIKPLGPDSGALAASSRGTSRIPLFPGLSYDPGGTACSLELYGPLRLAPAEPMRKHLPFSFPSRPFLVPLFR